MVTNWSSFAYDGWLGRSEQRLGSIALRATGTVGRQRTWQQRLRSVGRRRSRPLLLLWQYGNFLLFLRRVPDSVATVPQRVWHSGLWGCRDIDGMVRSDFAASGSRRDQSRHCVHAPREPSILHQGRRDGKLRARRCNVGVYCLGELDLGWNHRRAHRSPVQQKWVLSSSLHRLVHDLNMVRGDSIDSIGMLD